MIDTVGVLREMITAGVDAGIVAKVAMTFAQLAVVAQATTSPPEDRRHCDMSQVSRVTGMSEPEQPSLSDTSDPEKALFDQRARAAERQRKCRRSRRVTCHTQPDLPLSLREDLKRERKTRERVTRDAAPTTERTSLPAGWQPDDAGRAYAQARLGDVVDAEARRFADWHGHKGTTSADWAAAWRLWIDRGAARAATKAQIGLPWPPQQVVQAKPADVAPPACDASFSAVYAGLVPLVGAQVCASWFVKAVLTVEHNTAVVCLPTDFARQYVEGRYQGQLLTAIRRSMPDVKRLLLTAAAKAKAA